MVAGIKVIPVVALFMCLASQSVVYKCLASQSVVFQKVKNGSARVSWGVFKMYLQAFLV